MESSGHQSEAEANVGQRVILEKHGEVAVLRLGSPEEKVAVLTAQRMQSLRDAIRAVREDSSVQGLVIIGPHPTSFCAGADINVIRSVTDPAEGKRLAEEGQRIFDEIEQLSCRTVAAISGACVGGGCELVLSCKHRILTDLPQTKIGLPEVKLGIIPGFGGTQRLPRLIGIVNALQIILKGQVVNASRALSVGLADRVVGSNGQAKGPEDLFKELEQVAIAVASGKTTISPRSLSFQNLFLTKTAVGRAFVRSRTLAALHKEMRGAYPAPAKAVESVVTGLARGQKAGLEYEAAAIGELIVGPVSKSLVNIYMLSEEAARLGRGVKLDLAKTPVAVIGGGVMGAGIAASYLGAGLNVSVFDVSNEARVAARGRVEGILEKRRSLNTERREKMLSKLKLVADLAELKDAEVVVEAIVEDLKIKRSTFQQLAGIIPKGALLATNTSSLSVTEIANGVSGADRVLGMHFFNPVEKMPLVEIVCGKETSERSIIFTAALVSVLGKYPIVVKDVPGFLVNRILTPYLVEAAHLLAEGIPPKIIDDAAVEFGMPMGPIRLLDEIGLDVAAKVTEIMEAGYGERMKGPRLAPQLVAVGRFGRKSQKGFYKYKGKEVEVDSDLGTLLNLRFDTAKASKVNISERLILPMVNEAIRCLDEGVAGAPGREAAGQIDLGSVMGFGFAPFRGGIVHYADTVGARAIFQRLTAYRERSGERFTPCDGIRIRAERGMSFREAVK